MQQQQPPKQTIYPAVQVRVGQVPGGQPALIINTPTDGQLVFPMDDEAVKTIGQALIAPRVVMPGANGLS